MILTADVNDFQYIYNFLKIAFNKSAKLPRCYKKEIINICLQYLLKDFSFEKKERIILFIKNNSNKIKPTLCPTIFNSSSCVDINKQPSAIEAISRVDMLFDLNDRAMQVAAMSVFNRLLEALDPVVIKKTVRKKLFSSSVKYEAAVYNAYVDKYQRVKRYNDTGKLAGDFHMRFKECLKEELSRAGEI